MFKFFQYIAIIGACFLALACRARVSPEISPVIPDEYYRDMHSREVEKIEADYMARCKISVKNKKLSAAGPCELILTRSGQFRFTVSHPFGGVLSVFYMDRDNIQVLDRRAKKFYQLPNNIENRKRFLPIAGASPNELQDILWGRKILSNGNQLEFLVDNRTPRGVIIRDKPNLVVKYLKWLEYKENLFPKIIKMEDVKNNVFLKIVITEFFPGSARNIKINNIPKDYQKSVLF